MYIEILIIALLVLIGLVLLALEVCLFPGIGITGVLGTASMIGAVVYAFNFCAVAGWCTLFIVIVSLVVLILWAIYGRTIDNVALKKNIDSTVQDPDAPLLAVGDEGVAVTRLALVGNVDFNGQLVEVTSADGLIDEGAKVAVCRIAAGVYFVKRK